MHMILWLNAQKSTAITEIIEKTCVFKLAYDFKNE